ncbi:two-component response regulator-like PRR95 [Phalaenopsis equestris]|uniref:two-component response regulator-like PRR95 n=1 Tax=Phalaenopsis equestris TaxID=78828 RepID=UPI0009E50BEF|nr:two-component response regulator-like PRR95 [Phalaenopsis equestris]
MGGVQKGMGLEAKVEAKVEEGDEEVTWEKLLLRAPVRVLLVERDDSTRQIIAALLRKCGYRVTVASDGLKAWEMVREKEHNIDLVLTEVELPEMSGVVLLTMMMDRDSCNHIPVIMMSSNDSVSIAFKCMIKGAADFLVKPIRKNELKNIWQHVWRKQKDGIGATRNKMADLLYDRSSIKNATDKQDDMDCCEKESDAQSSCTRSDMEVESPCKLRNNAELILAQHKHFPLFPETISSDNQFEKRLDGLSLFPNDEVNGVISLGSNNQPEEKSNYEELDRDESSTGMFNLIDVINNQPPHISVSEKSRDNFDGNHPVEENLETKQGSILSLELSLDVCSRNIPDCKENDGSNTLHHSNSSAFSLYSNNSTDIPKLSKLTDSQAQNNGSSNSSVEPPPYHPAANSSHYNASIPETDAAFRCTPIRLIPFPVPVGDTCFASTGSNPFLQSIFYHPSPSPFWSAMPAISQEAYTETHSHQFGFHTLSEEVHSPKSLGFQVQPWHEGGAEIVDEQRHVSPVTGDSASVCNDSRYNMNENGSAGDEDGFQKFGEMEGADRCRLNQREAALKKFRMKRKERCFEKKVRYLSRKKLAEQRPRVKGQFVRQA